MKANHLVWLLDQRTGFPEKHLTEFFKFWLDMLYLAMQEPSFWKEIHVALPGLHTYSEDRKVELIIKKLQ